MAQTLLKSDDYEVEYTVETQTLRCKGSLELSGTEEYRPIAELFNHAVSQLPPLLTLDLRGLEFLNSSGINVISKFVIAVRQKGTVGLLVLGSRQIPWQGKSLPNLQRLMPAIKLEIS
jgi:hypothetical protein